MWSKLCSHAGRQPASQSVWAYNIQNKDLHKFKKRMKDNSTKFWQLSRSPCAACVRTYVYCPCHIHIYYMCKWVCLSATIPRYMMRAVWTQNPCVLCLNMYTSSFVIIWTTFFQNWGIIVSLGIHLLVHFKKAIVHAHMVWGLFSGSLKPPNDTSFWHSLYTLTGNLNK